MEILLSTSSNQLRQSQQSDTYPIRIYLMNKISLVKASGRDTARTYYTESAYTPSRNAHHFLPTHQLGRVQIDQTSAPPSHIGRPQAIDQIIIESSKQVGPRTRRFQKNNWVKSYCPWIVIGVGAFLLMGMLTWFVINLVQKDRKASALQNGENHSQQFGNIQAPNASKAKIQQQEVMTKNPQTLPFANKEAETVPANGASDGTSLGQSPRVEGKTQQNRSEKSTDIPQNPVKDSSVPAIQSPVSSQFIHKKHHIVKNSNKPIENKQTILANPSTHTPPHRRPRRSTKHVVDTEIYQNFWDQNQKDEDIKRELARKHLKRES